MRVLGYDLESTGLDTSTARILEVGAVVWDTDAKVPLQMLSRFVSGVTILPEHQQALDVNGIKPEWLQLGDPLKDIFSKVISMCCLYDVDYIVAHNGMGYDMPLTYAETKRLGCEFPLLPLIDTRYDLPFKTEPKSRSLNHLIAEHGFLNPFPHRALFDVMAMLKLMSMYEFREIIALSKIPWVTARALVDYDNREKAKEMRFSWEKLGDKTHPKCWVKKIRENQLEREQKLAEEKGFKIIRIE